MADIPVHHAPAAKVGGRRLSISHPKPKTHSAPVETSAPEDNNVTDYPRPSPEHHDAPHHEPPPHNEEPPLKEKEILSIQEQKIAQRKLEENRPRREPQAGGKAFIRISQPAGKGFNAY
ncbi:hypothetical protein FISHEDRAFT_70201 [Fistulina hepatica ATCC 64428]|uniref:Uncharacterized protein n=1 Tax=Fistulina hepatica ATCC 64428 TaxID=1128425 RepID=A0A0D7AJC5_9AGAR|nr:hypothetical protein FISHEDRAFT_70201 [Fistulina hepatica ATCC 64428]